MAARLPTVTANEGMRVPLSPPNTPPERRRLLADRATLCRVSALNAALAQRLAHNAAVLAQLEALLEASRDMLPTLTDNTNSGSTPQKG